MEGVQYNQNHLHYLGVWNLEFMINYGKFFLPNYKLIETNEGVWGNFPTYELSSLVQELEELFPNAPKIARPGQINAWDNEDFVKVIETGKKNLIIAGVVTDVCVAFPALFALNGGYEVFAVTDASGTVSKQVADAALARMAHGGVQLMNWFSAACELQRDWRNDVEGFGAFLVIKI